MNSASTLSRLGRYELLRVLGQGAMGVVYEGLDPALGRQVAIKTILRSALHDADTAADTSARFVREAQAIARLSHPHIVMVFDFGEEGDVAYFVMEFVRGRDLKSALDDGDSFSLTDTVRIVCELLSALDFAHRNGVVHRDVKPANVMLDGGGHVKLTDFGVARLADSAGERTQAGTMVGTPSYMSPEQILGQPVGSRTDIFAVGIILYQCLTGIKPFLGPGTWAIQKQIVHDDPVPPSVVRPEIHPAFDTVLARALAKDPQARYGTAGEFADALKSAAAHASDPGVKLAGRATDTTPAAEATVAATVVETAHAEEPRPIAAEDAVPSIAEAVPMAPSRRRSIGPLVAAGLGVAALAAFYLFNTSQHTAAIPQSAPQATTPKEAATPSAPADAAPPAVSAPAPAVPAVEQPKAQAPTPRTVTEELPKPVPEVPKRTVAHTLAAPAAERPVQPSGKTSRARCDDLLQRFQIGDTLSPEELNALQKECHK